MEIAFRLPSSTANAYVVSGSGVNLKTSRNLLWSRTCRQPDGSAPISEPTRADQLNGNATFNFDVGQQMVSTDSGKASDGALFVLQDADERGDGTVPIRSGKTQPNDVACGSTCLPQT